MNRVILTGNMTRDPEVRMVGEHTCANFTLAVQRRFRAADGNRETDFINCVAWRQPGEFIARYCTKGDRIGVVGTMQTRSYEAKDGSGKRYITEVVCDEVESYAEKRGAAPKPARTRLDDLPEAPDDLPF